MKRLIATKQTKYNKSELNEYFEGNDIKYTEDGVEITLPVSDLLDITGIDGDFVDYINLDEKITIKDWDLDSVKLDFDEDPEDEDLYDELDEANLHLSNSLIDIFENEIWQK